LKQKQTARRPSLADQPKDCCAIEKAIGEQWELLPNKQSDPEKGRIDTRIDLNSDTGRPLTAIILLREIGIAINRILESGGAISRTRALVAAGYDPEHAGKEALADYAMFAEPFRRAGASYARKGYSHNSIKKEVDGVSATLLGRFDRSWTHMTGDGDLLACLLARPVHEAVWEAEKIIEERTGVSPSAPKAGAPLGSEVVAPIVGRGVGEKEESAFIASEDYCSIKYKGVSYTLTRNQSTIIRLLHEAYLKGTSSLSKLALLSAIEAETSRVRDSFKSSELWSTLIVANRSPRGTYRLNLR
jgi:hypothetical protein